MNETIDERRIASYEMQYALLFHNNKDQVIEIFEESLERFWEGNLLGFDVVAFDEWLEVQEGVSTKEHVKDI